MFLIFVSFNFVALVQNLTRADSFGCCLDAVAAIMIFVISMTVIFYCLLLLAFVS